jgi:hypothetical protein
MNQTASQNVTQQNPGFKDVTQLFLEKGWTIKINQPTRLEFQSPTSEYDSFEFQIDKTGIYVTVPLKTSRYKYSAKFADYYSASDFAEMHLCEYNQ